MAAGYEIQENDRATGPHSLAVLLQKAEIRVLRPDSLVRLAASSGTDREPWLPIREIPELHAHLFPPRDTPKLATTAPCFEPTNAAADATHSNTDVFALLRENADRQRSATGELLKDLGPRPNNRLRDYIVSFLALNLFAAFAGHFVGYINPFVIALAVMGNIGLVWVLYFVMDRY